VAHRHRHRHRRLKARLHSVRRDRAGGEDVAAVAAGLAARRGAGVAANGIPEIGIAGTVAAVVVEVGAMAVGTRAISSRM
jgi:hypothetical protein